MISIVSQFNISFPTYVKYSARIQMDCCERIFISISYVPFGENGRILEVETSHKFFTFFIFLTIRFVLFHFYFLFIEKKKIRNRIQVAGDYDFLHRNFVAVYATCSNIYSHWRRHQRDDASSNSKFPHVNEFAYLHKTQIACRQDLVHKTSRYKDWRETNVN